MSGGFDSHPLPPLPCDLSSREHARPAHAFEPEHDVRPARARRHRHRAARRRPQPRRGAQALRDAPGRRGAPHPRLARPAHSLLRHASRPRRRPLPAGGGAHRPAQTLPVRDCPRHTCSGYGDRPRRAAGLRGRPATDRVRHPLHRHRLAADHGRDRGGKGACPRDQADRRLPGTVVEGRARLPGTGRAAPARGDRGRSRGDRAGALPPVPPSHSPCAGRGAGRGRDHRARGDARGRRVARPLGTAPDDPPARRARRAAPRRPPGGRGAAGPGRGGDRPRRAGRGRLRPRDRGDPRRRPRLARRQRARSRRRGIRTGAGDVAVDGRPVRVRGRGHRLVRRAPAPEVRRLRGPPGAGARREPCPARGRTAPPILSTATPHPRPHFERRPERGRVLGPSRPRRALGVARQGLDRSALDAEVPGASGDGGRARSASGARGGGRRGRRPGGGRRCAAARRHSRRGCLHRGRRARRRRRHALRGVWLQGRERGAAPGSRAPPPRGPPRRARRVRRRGRRRRAPGPARQAPRPVRRPLPHLHRRSRTSSGGSRPSTA